MPILLLLSGRCAHHQARMDFIDQWSQQLCKARRHNISVQIDVLSCPLLSCPVLVSPDLHSHFARACHAAPCDAMPCHAMDLQGATCGHATAGESPKAQESAGVFWRCLRTSKPHLRTLGLTFEAVMRHARPSDARLHATCGRKLQSIVGSDYLASESARRRTTSCNRRAPHAT